MPCHLKKYAVNKQSCKSCAIIPSLLELLTAPIHSLYNREIQLCSETSACKVARVKSRLR